MPPGWNGPADPPPRWPRILRIDTHLCAWHDGRHPAEGEAFFHGPGDLPGRIYGICRAAAQRIRRAGARAPMIDVPL